MLPPERILFPVDDSPLSLSFSESVKSLALACGAHVVLLDVNQLDASGRVCNTPLIRFWESAMRELTVEWKFVRGDASTQIVQAAAEHDLTMMPWPAAGFLQRWFGSSVVETVLRQCPSAFWTASTRKPAGRRLPMRIACAVDLFPDSARIALNAAFLANTFDADLVLLHSMPRLDEGMMILAAGRDLPPTLNKSVARRELESMCSVSQRCIEPVIVQGDAPRAIPSALKKLNADLLVIGPGRQVPGHLKLGSLVLDIVRASPCPVLVLDKEQPRLFNSIDREPEDDLALEIAQIEQHAAA